VAGGCSSSALPGTGDVLAASVALQMSLAGRADHPGLRESCARRCVIRLQASAGWAARWRPCTSGARPRTHLRPRCAWTQATPRCAPGAPAAERRRRRARPLHSSPTAPARECAHAGRRGGPRRARAGRARGRVPRGARGRAPPRPGHAPARGVRAAPPPMRLLARRAAGRAEHAAAWAQARRREVRNGMERQFRESMAAPGWELEDYDWCRPRPRPPCSDPPGRAPDGPPRRGLAGAGDTQRAGPAGVAGIRGQHTNQPPCTRYEKYLRTPAGARPSTRPASWSGRTGARPWRPAHARAGRAPRGARPARCPVRCAHVQVQRPCSAPAPHCTARG